MIRRPIRPPKKSGRRFLTGSALSTEQPAKPRQEPPIPVHQLQPNHAEQLVARESLGLSKTPKPKRSVRELNRLTRKQVAALLRTEGVAAAIPEWQANLYLDLVAGRTSLTEIGERLRCSDAGAKVLVDGWETEIMRKYLFLYKRLPAPEAKGTPGLAEELADIAYDRAQDKYDRAGDDDLAANYRTGFGRGDNTDPLD